MPHRPKFVRHIGHCGTAQSCVQRDRGPTATARDDTSACFNCGAVPGGVGGCAGPPGGTPQTPTRMTIHHTEVVLGDNANAPARLRQHQHYHQDSQGWIDIAYHMSVDRNGNIYQLRNPEIVGDTATSYDPTGHFLVVCEGDFDEEEVTEQQLNGAALAFAWAAGRFNIATDTLTGHRDESSETTCPGASLYAHVTSADLRSRVDGICPPAP